MPPRSSSLSDRVSRWPAERRLVALAELSRRMRRLSHWAGIHACGTDRLREERPELESDLAVVFPDGNEMGARRGEGRREDGRRRGGRSKAAEGERARGKSGVLSADADTHEDRARFRLLDAYHAVLRREAPWDMGSGTAGQTPVFVSLPRSRFWEELRQVDVFGPLADRRRKEAALRGCARRFAILMGHPWRGRGAFEAFVPRRVVPGGLGIFVPSACAVGRAVFVLTPDCFACFFTGDDD